MIETWVDIPNYEGLYQASDKGGVRSLDRTVNHKDGSKTFRKGKVLKQTDNGRGYFHVFLSKNSVEKNSPVHQIVALCFLNHKPCGFNRVINHIDMNPKNNRLDNLEIVSVRQNLNRKHQKHTSKYVGVGYDKRKRKWRSRIYIDGERKYLGMFNCETAAHIAYESAISNLEPYA